MKYSASIAQPSAGTSWPIPSKPATSLTSPAAAIAPSRPRSDAWGASARARTGGQRDGANAPLGQLRAEKLGVPFVELNRMVEQDYGASVPLLIEMSGIATFRRYERACLERV